MTALTASRHGGNEVFRSLLAGLAVQRAEVRALVHLIRQSGRLADVSYRCDGGNGGRSGCLLLAVYVLPTHGPVLYRKACRLTHADAAGQGSDRSRTDIPADAFPLADLPDDGTARTLALCRHRVMHLWPGRIAEDVVPGRVQRIMLPNGQTEAQVYR